MDERRSTLRASAPEPAPSSPKFSTLMVRSAVNSRVSAWPAASLVRRVCPPIVPCTSKGSTPAAMGTARSFTSEPPSSKLDW